MECAPTNYGHLHITPLEGKLSEPQASHRRAVKSTNMFVLLCTPFIAFSILSLEIFTFYRKHRVN